MKYAAFLRGINVSGQNRIKMAALKELFEKNGCENVTTCLQSGNVVFDTKQTDASAIETRLEVSIKKDLGLDIKVVVRSLKYVSKIVANNPFLTTKYDREFLHATMMKHPVKAIDTKSIDEKKEKKEAYAVSGDCVYLYCPNGYGRTKLNNASWEKWCGDIGTTRSWKTVLAIKDMMGVDTPHPG